MKKSTILIAFLLCGFVGLQAQRLVNTIESSVFGISSNVQVANATDSDDSPKFTITGKVLTAKNLENGVQVDIYSVLGAKVHSFVYAGNPVVLNLNKGLYIIRVDKFTQKIML
ncbi:MAG: T9SS type A sorting domain-containing protein [Paludibacteraceae bacterium]